MMIYRRICKIYSSWKQLDDTLMKGFTLIELLVVISLLGVFASVALSSLDKARESAKSTANNLIIREYSKALESSYTRYGSYPIAEHACLGETSDGYCGFTTNSTVQAAVNSRISSFYPAMVNFDPVIMDNGDSFRGPIYSCTDPIGPPTKCKKYIIIWFQEGRNQVCLSPDGNPAGVQYQGNTFCEYEPY